MATKTISIDTEAYERLKRVQKENESFSQTIKRVVWDPAVFDHWLRDPSRKPMSNAAIDAVERVVAARRAKPRATASPPRRRTRGAA